MPPIGDPNLGTPATAALWVGFACMFASACYFSYKVYAPGAKGNGKLYNILTNLVVSCASLAYLVMALGGTAVPTLNARAFLWVRYADWLVTTPLLLIDLGLLVGAPLLEIGWVVAMDVLMVVAGFAGAISTGTNAAWPLLAIGCLFFLPVLHALVASFAESAKAKGAKTFALYSKLAVLLGVTWTAYPIIWGVSEGAQIASANAETIAYAFFDIVAKCVFGFILVEGHAAIEDDKVASSEPGPAAVSTEAPLTGVVTANAGSA